MDNTVIFDKSDILGKSDVSGILAKGGQNLGNRDICEEECDCLEEFISGKADESDIWDEEDEAEFEDILRRARESQVSGF